MKNLKLILSMLTSLFITTTSYSSDATGTRPIGDDGLNDYSAQYKKLMLPEEQVPEGGEAAASKAQPEIKKVGIIGAGIAGLYSGLLINQMNETSVQKIEFKIFEANNRVGGRIYTYRFNRDSDQYFEAGAMRIPQTHKEFFNLIDYVNEKLEEKYQSISDEHERNKKINKYKVELINYVLHHKNNYIYANGQSPKTREEVLGQDFNYAHFQFKDEKGNFINESPFKKFENTIKERRNELIAILKDQDQAKFDEFLNKYDDYSMRSYLLREEGLSHEMINYIEVMTAQTHQFNHSFVELLIEDLDFSNTQWKTIDQGMSRLPEACAKLIGKSNILLNAKVKKIVEDKESSKVLIYHSASGKPEEFDRIILAVPPSVVRMLDRGHWPDKEEAIRSIYFEPLYKIGLRFNERIWEQGDKGSRGGQSTTDLPSRWIVYPSNGISSSEPGVLLCYSWASDALKWLPQTAKEQEEGALCDLLKLHPHIRKEFVESKSISWAKEWSLGDAKFLPGQLKKYHRKAGKPEGNVFFAGEHLSLYHTWIRGALDSAHTTVKKMFNKQISALGTKVATSASNVEGAVQVIGSAAATEGISSQTSEKTDNIPGI